MCLDKLVQMIRLAVLDKYKIANCFNRLDKTIDDKLCFQIKTKLLLYRYFVLCDHGGTNSTSLFYKTPMFVRDSTNEEIMVVILNHTIDIQKQRNGKRMKTLSTFVRTSIEMFSTADDSSLLEYSVCLLLCSYHSVSQRVCREILNFFISTNLTMQKKNNVNKLYI